MLSETLHDTTFAKDQANQLFNSGVLPLRDRAAVELGGLGDLRRVGHQQAADRLARMEVPSTSTGSSQADLIVPDPIEQILPELVARV